MKRYNRILIIIFNRDVTMDGRSYEELRSLGIYGKAMLKMLSYSGKLIALFNELCKRRFDEQLNNEVKT